MHCTFENEWPPLDWKGFDAAIISTYSNSDDLQIIKNLVNTENLSKCCI